MNALKKLLPLALTLCLLLASCGGGSATAYDPDKATQAILDSGCFSVELSELDAALQYDFEGYGLDTAALTASKTYAASGFTEQVSVTVWKDDAAAKNALEFFQQYLLDQKDTYESYAPNEIPKLDSAVLVQRGSSVLLVVAADSGKAQAAADKL